MNEHICQPAFCGLPGGMRELYSKLGLIPTSTCADVVLIRSHVAYWGGQVAAELADIRPSRGHTYRVDGRVVRITNYYDHREGVTGYCDPAGVQRGLWAE